MAYNFAMQVSAAEVKDRLPEVIRAVNSGEQVLLTDEGQPVAQITAPPAAAAGTEKRKVVLGSMEGQIKFLPGWDDPMTEEEFFGKRLHDRYE